MQRARKSLAVPIINIPEWGGAPQDRPPTGHYFTGNCPPEFVFILAKNARTLPYINLQGETKPGELIRKNTRCFRLEGLAIHEGKWYLPIRLNDDPDGIIYFIAADTLIHPTSSRHPSFVSQKE